MKTLNNHVFSGKVGPLILAAFFVVLSVLAPAGEASEKRLTVPPGFRIDIFASGLGGPRFMAFDAAGNLFVTVPQTGEVVVLPDRNKDGRADGRAVFAGGLNKPHGIAFHDGYVYVAEEGRVVRFGYKGLGFKGENMEVIIPDLPRGGNHVTRTLGFGPDGKMYVSIGSSCNACRETDPRRAAIMVFDPDGSNGRLFAQGLRNAVGFVWGPESGAMWATDNGRDLLGDDLPPDELNLVQDGVHYGWPFCYGNRVPDPELGDPQFCPDTQPASFEFQAHSAPLGLSFYRGALFPVGYRGDLFVAFHGSWNRSVPTGYKVVRVKMKGGTPEGIKDFVTGWLVGGSAWGRPVDIVVDALGRMFVSDDFGGKIYVITYRK